jgi:putative membrane protein
MLREIRRGVCRALIAVALALPAAGLPDNEQQTSSRNQPGAASREVTTQTSTDRKFLQGVASGEIEEMELGILAAQKAASDQVRRLGQRMYDDHAQLSDLLNALLQVKGLALPSSRDGKQQRELERLQKLSGADFDRAYMKLLIDDHQKDIREFRKQAQRATDPDIKSFAANTLPKLHDHLAMAQEAVRTAKFTDPGKKASATSAATSERDRTSGMADSAAARARPR